MCVEYLCIQSKIQPQLIVYNYCAASKQNAGKVNLGFFNETNCHLKQQTLHSKFITVFG